LAKGHSIFPKLLSPLTTLVASEFCKFSSILTFPGEVKNRKHGSSFRDFFFNWRKIALQCYIGFSCTTMQISHTYTYFTSLLSFHPLPNPSPLGHHRAPACDAIQHHGCYTEQQLLTCYRDRVFFFFFLRHKWQEDLLDVKRNRKSIGNAWFQVQILHCSGKKGHSCSETECRSWVSWLTH